MNLAEIFDADSILGSWLPLGHLQFTAPDYRFVIFNLRLLITTLLSTIYGLLLPLCHLQLTAPDYHFVIFNLRLPITTAIFNIRLLISTFILAMNLAEIFDADSILCNHRRDRMLVGFATILTISAHHH
jgi:hypothetical protein